MRKKHPHFISSMAIIVLSVASVLAFSGCETLDPIEDIPSFIRIDSTTFVTTEFTEGGAAARIEDVWVNANDEFIGVFPVPSTIPFHNYGTTNIVLRPGVRINGISSARAPHPYYTTFDADLNLVEDSTFHINPQIRFNDIADLAWIEDFESQGFSLSGTNNTEAQPQRNQNPETAFVGECALLRLEPGQLKFECVNDTEFDLPKLGNTTLLEFQYRSNNSFVVGVFRKQTTNIIQTPIITLNPTDEWTRIYVNVTEYVSNPATKKLTVFFGFIRDEGNEGNADVLLDNIKLVY